MAGRERLRRIDRRTAEYHNLRALGVDTNDDVPDHIVAGRRIGGSYYTPEGFLRGTRGSAEYIVTRPEGYRLTNLLYSPMAAMPMTRIRSSILEETMRR